MSTDMFGAPIEAPAKKLSYGARITENARKSIARGRHPFGRALADNGRTCGDCWFALRLDGGRKSYWKCERNRLSNSEATDLRVSWPACDLFTATKPERWETRVPADIKRGGR